MERKDLVLLVSFRLRSIRNGGLGPTTCWTEPSIIFNLHVRIVLLGTTEFYPSQNVSMFDLRGVLSLSRYICTIHMSTTSLVCSV